MAGSKDPAVFVLAEYLPFITPAVATPGAAAPWHLATAFAPFPVGY
jgi:hypothetical protein